MASSPINHRWTAGRDLFARRITIEDDDVPRGWINNSIVIEPGTRAFAVVDGRPIGEVTDGEFTFKTFRERLQFWRRGQATILLTRTDIVRVPIDCNGFVSSDGVPVDIRVEVGVQVADPGLFLTNMLGPRNDYSIEELAKRLAPPVRQEAWVAVSGYAAADIRSPATTVKISQQIVTAAESVFKRYGLSIAGVESMAVQPKGMEKHWERVTENMVEVAGERLGNERMKDDVGILSERVGLREQLRDLAVSDTLDKVKSAEELKALVAGVDKQRLLRKEEMDQLIEGYEERKNDRQSLREHLLATLSINREQEVDRLRAAVAHSLQVQSLRNDLELAEASTAVENQQWRAEIAREIELAERRREERRKDLDAKWERVRERQKQRQDGSWEKLLHDQREEAIRTELALKEADRRSRLALIDAELATRVEEQKIVGERLRREFELEMGGRESDAQFDRLKRVQDLNFDGHARQAQLEAELKGQAESRANSHELERLRTMGTLSAEALIAGSGVDNARALAELKMQEAKSQAEIHAAGRGDQQTLNEERLRLYERLSEAEKSKADAIADVFQQALKGQQVAVEQMITGLAAANTPARTAAPRAAAPPPAPGAAPEWHVIGEGNAQSGPHTLRQVQMMVQQGRLLAEALVWRAGMDGWVAIADCGEFADVFATVPPPPPPPPPRP